MILRVKHIRAELNNLIALRTQIALISLRTPTVDMESIHALHSAHTKIPDADGDFLGEGVETRGEGGEVGGGVVRGAGVGSCIGAFTVGISVLGG